MKWQIIATVVALNLLQPGVARSDAPAEKRVPDPNLTLGPCNPEMANPFPERKRLQVLITRYGGTNEAADAFGADIGVGLKTTLPEYVRVGLGPEERRVGLDPSDFQAEYVPCQVTSHDEARAIGRAWGADLVLWGRTVCNLADRKQCVTLRLKLDDIGEQFKKFPPGTSVNILSNVVSAQEKAKVTRTNQKIVLVEFTPPPVGASVNTSMTIVSWRGLEIVGEKGVRLSDRESVLDFDFPRLASARPMALFHFVLGVYAYRSQRYGLAASYFERSQEEVYAGAEKVENLHRIIGITYITAGQPERGLKALEQALTQCGSQNLACRSVALNNLGWAVARLGDNLKAIHYFEQSLELVRQLGDVSGAATLNNIGAVYDAMGDKPKALSYYEQALPLFRKVGDVSGEATTLNNIGFVYDALGDKPKALSYYEQALPLRRKVGDVSHEAGTLNNIGLVYYALGDKLKALSYFEQALPLRQKVGDVSGEAATLNNIGAVYSAVGDKPKALSYFEQALPLHRKVGNVSGEADTLGNIGHVYDAMGDKPKALSYFEQTLPLFRKVGNVSGEATTLNNIGDVYSAVGDKPKALSYFEQARDGFQKVRDPWSLAVVHDHLGAIHDALGHPLDAIDYCRKAAALYAKRPNIKEATGSLGLALTIAIKHKLLPEGRAILADLKQLGLSEIALALLEARFLRTTASPPAEVAAAYRTALPLAAKHPPDEATIPTHTAHAGVDRAEHPDAFAGCDGLLVTQVVPASQAQTLGLQPGDVLLRYRGTCLAASKDLIDAVSKVPPTDDVPLDLRRDSKTLRLRVHGGKLGVGITEF